MPAPLAMAVSFCHQDRSSIAAAQVDDGADAAALEKGSKPAGPGLHGARGFPGHHPVEIVEKVRDCSDWGRSHRMELAYFGTAMRITKQTLVRRWAVTTVLAAIVFAVLAWSDLRLKALSGFGTADLQGFSTAAEYRRAFMAWPSLYAVRAGFNWGLDYLLMPLYAAAFLLFRHSGPRGFCAPAGPRPPHPDPAGGGAHRRRAAGCGRKCPAILLDAVGPHRLLARLRRHPSPTPNGWRSMSAWRCGWGRCWPASRSASSGG